MNGANQAGLTFDPTLFSELTMTLPSRWKNTIERGNDLAEIREHFLRLDQQSLYCRFGAIVTRDFLIQYVDQTPKLETFIFVCRVDGEVRGVGELRWLGLDRRDGAEAAFTVEKSFRDLGIGTALMATVLEKAVETKVVTVFVCFDSLNQRMRRIAEKYKYTVTSDGGDCIARIWVSAHASSAVKQTSAASDERE